MGDVQDEQMAGTTPLLGCYHHLFPYRNELSDCFLKQRASVGGMFGAVERGEGGRSEKNNNCMT